MLISVKPQNSTTRGRRYYVRGVKVCREAQPCCLLFRGRPRSCATQRVTESRCWRSRALHAEEKNAQFSSTQMRAGGQAQGGARTKDHRSLSEEMTRGGRSPNSRVGVLGGGPAVCSPNRRPGFASHNRVWVVDTATAETYPAQSFCSRSPPTRLGTFSTHWTSGDNPRLTLDKSLAQTHTQNIAVEVN